MCRKQAKVSLAAREHLGVARLDRALSSAVIVPLCSGAHQFGVRWNTVRCAGGLGHLLDGLHAGGAGADHRHALAREAHRLMRPAGGVEGLALEASRRPRSRGMVGADSGPIAVIRKRAR